MGPTYIKFYAHEWDADTLHLSTLEDGAYFRIMKYIWKTAKLPHESRLAMLTGLNPDQWEAVRPVLVEFFQVDEAGYWHHSRAMEDIDHVFTVIAAKSRGGKQSALARKALRKTKKTPAATDVKAKDDTEAATPVKMSANSTGVGTDDNSGDAAGDQAGVSTRIEENRILKNRIEDNSTEQHSSASDQLDQVSQFLKRAGAMTPTWLPNKTTIFGLKNDHGIPATFAQSIVPEFRIYWIDLQTVKTGLEWQDTFRRSVLKRWNQSQSEEHTDDNPEQDASGIGKTRSL